jgi:hypothetical protein
MAGLAGDAREQAHHPPPCGHLNPYIAGAPVTDDHMFVGRRKLFGCVVSLLRYTSLMITGEHRIGKTTFLFHLKRALECETEGESRFFPVFTDLQGVTERSLFRSVMGDMTDDLRLTSLNLRHAPEGGHYNARDFEHDLRQAIAELRTRTGKKVRLVLLMDEADMLGACSQGTNRTLRELLTRSQSGHLAAVMSGVDIARTWTSEFSCWYNVLKEVRLEPLGRDEAEELICRPVQDLLRYEPAAVEAILEHSRKIPYLIQKLCLHAVDHVLEQGRRTITALDVEAVRARMPG